MLALQPRRSACVRRLFSRISRCLWTARATIQIRFRVVVVLDTDVAVGPDLVAEGRHLLLALHAQDDDRLVGPARPVALDQVHGVQLAGLVADQHGVVSLVADAGQAGRNAQGLFQHHFRGAVGGKGLGQPAAGPLPGGDVQDPHAMRQVPPGGRLRPRGRGHFRERCHHRFTKCTPHAPREKFPHAEREEYSLPREPTDFAGRYSSETRPASQARLLPPPRNLPQCLLWQESHISIAVAALAAT